jgi:hypothetical protein
VEAVVLEVDLDIFLLQAGQLERRSDSVGPSVLMKVHPGEWSVRVVEDRCGNAPGFHDPIAVRLALRAAHRGPPGRREAGVEGVVDEATEVEHGVVVGGESHGSSCVLVRVVVIRKNCAVAQRAFGGPLIPAQRSGESGCK